jgi:3-oxoadipate enol-lactonase
MSFVSHDGARIHWQALGTGEPLVLIMGLGCCQAMWFRLAPRLARHFRVILLDNRGVGQTEVRHFVVHRVTTMAADVAAVLDAAGQSSAHVLGLSMGGMIAQEFALQYPARVRSLILAATNCGGSRAILAEAKVWRLLFTKADMPPEAALEAMRPYTYAATTPASLIDEDHLVRLANVPTSRGYQAQLYGLMGWTSYGRLPQLACPTLVLHGQQDLLIPPQNGRLLAARIRDAELVELADASHWIHTDQLEATAAAVQKFINAREAPAP